MDAEKANFEITRMARLLGVTRRGYYARQRRRQHGPGPRAKRRTVIDQAVREQFRASDDVYGAPRITRELAAKGVVIDRKTVAASTRRQGLEGISPSMFTPVTTIQDPAARGFADHAQRRWDQGRLDAIWISDITYLRTGEGWFYLAAVRDGHSRRVLGRPGPKRVARSLAGSRSSSIVAGCTPASTTPARSRSRMPSSTTRPRPKNTQIRLKQLDQPSTNGLPPFGLFGPHRSSHLL